MTQLSRASFSETKASEVALYFLLRAREHDRSVTKLRLIKWMYLAERMSYEQFGEPLTGDTLCSMQHGPVPSTTLYLVERPHVVTGSNGAWKSVVNVVREKNHEYLNIRSDCQYESTDDLRHLSDAEVELLDEVWLKFGKMSSKKLETYLHDPEKTPEWQWAPGDKSNPIELEDLLAAIGYNKEQIVQLVGNIQAFEGIDKAFA